LDNYIPKIMKKILLYTCFVLFGSFLHAQKNKADSIDHLLLIEKLDSNKVKLMWQKASYIYNYAPDTAILLAQKALLLSKQIRYIEGESRSLGQLANGFLSIGDYSNALKFYIEKLQLEEKRNNAYNLASATMNIGIVYVYEEEYNKALFYFKRADSLITANHIEKLAYNIKLNIGDAYEKQNITNLAYKNFSEALIIAKKILDDNRIGMAMVGLGHTFLKLHNLFTKSR
jgi:tetratricopeptide (TPR) repeat protein